MNDPTASYAIASHEKVKCYGKTAAITAEATLLPHAEYGKTRTVNLEVAPREIGSKRFDWDRKIVLQLSDVELPLLCALLLGFQSSLKVQRPGKGIEFERQEGKLFIRASAGTGNLFSLPVTPGDCFRLSALCLRQLMSQSGLGESLVLAALRGAATLDSART